MSKRFIWRNVEGELMLCDEKMGSVSSDVFCALTRLVEYQELGTVEELTEKLESAKNTISELRAQLEMYRGFDGSRLHQIIDADMDGRLAVLPCKVGDTVYVIDYCESVVKHYDDIYDTRIRCPFEYDCNCEECNDDNLRIFKTTCAGFWLENLGEWKMFVGNLYPNIDLSDFGKTWFLTHEEAEVKLAKESTNDN